MRKSIETSITDKHFRVLSNTFLKTEFELIFTKSVYVKNFLEENFTSYVKTHFGVTYAKGDIEDRILILTHFPTSLEYFFDARNTPYEFGNFDRKVTLDLGLLHALSVDVLKYPQGLEGETFLAAQSIARTLSDEIFPFLKICTSIPDAVEKKKEVIELFKQGTNPFDSEKEIEVKGKLTVTTTMTKNQLPNLDFMTLMFASSIAGVPIEFSKDIAVKNIEFDNDSGIEELQSNSKFLSIKLMPNVEHKEFKLSSLFNFDINDSRRELTLRLLKDKTGNPNEYPYEFNIIADGKGEVIFNFNCHMSGKISEVYRFNAMMKKWNEEGFRRLIVYSGNEDQEVMRIVPPNIRSDIGTFIDKLKDVLSVSNTDIDDSPYLIKGDIIEKIEKLDDSEILRPICDEIIEDIKAAIPKQITKVFLHIRDEEERTLITKCLGIVPYWFDMNSFNITTYNKNNKKLLKDISERKHNFNLRKYCFGYSMQELFDEIVRIFKSCRKYPIEKALDHMVKDRGELAQFIININFLPSVETFWQKEQTIEIVIKRADIEIKKVNTLN